ncbi:hypothetical protein F4859DRAFT_513342 [Xylaria cf. heliscus]|nr:hypothetical protein F4859DRAFT_513342 [Xylaria cf. heliscus]
MTLNYNAGNSGEFTIDYNEQFWPGGNYSPSLISEGTTPTSMDSGVVGQNFIVGHDSGIHSTLGLISLPISPTTVIMDTNRSSLYATPAFTGDPHNLDAFGLNHAYSLPATQRALAPQNAAAMYGPIGHLNEPLLSPSWPPLSPPRLSPPELPLTPAIPSKPHICTQCPGATACFTLRKDLNRHIRTVHATGDERVYRCRCKKDGTMLLSAGMALVPWAVVLFSRRGIWGQSVLMSGVYVWGEDWVTGSTP